MKILLVLLVFLCGCSAPKPEVVLAEAPPEFSKGWHIEGGRDRNYDSFYLNSFNEWSPEEPKVQGNIVTLTGDDGTKVFVFDWLKVTPPKASTKEN